MYVPFESGRIILRVAAKKKNRNFLNRQSVRVKGIRKMSHSPTELAAGWTFVSTSSELNEEMRSVDAAVDKSNVNEGSKSFVEEIKDANVDVAKTEEIANPSGVEELEEDTPSSSESESLPSSDVDVLEESVGPDHDILEVSSSSHASIFSISSPLEGLTGFCQCDSVDIDSEVTEKDTVTNQDVTCQPGGPVMPEFSTVRSPKSLAEAAARVQLVQSSKIPDNSSHSKPKEHLQDPIPMQNSSLKTPDNLSNSECKGLSPEQRQKTSKILDSLSHSKPEEPLHEQVNEQKLVVKKQRPKQKGKKHQEISVFKTIVEICPIVKELPSEITAVIIYLGLWCISMVAVTLLLPSSNDMGFLSTNAAKELKYAQDETLKCLGLQHLTAVENNHYTLLLTNVCMNDSAAWKEIFARILRNKDIETLMHDVYHESLAEKKTEIIEKFASLTKTDMQGMKLDLIILQMEHLELLRSSEENIHTKEKHENSVVPDLLSEKLEEQEGMLSQLHECIERLKLANFALKSLDAELNMTDTDGNHTELKPRIYRLELENAFLSYRLQHMLDEFENGEFLDPEYWLGSFNLNSALNNIGSSTMEELMEKVNYLLSSNDEMRRLYSHFAIMKKHFKRSDRTETNPDKPAEFSKARIENLESLIKDLLGVRQLMSGELLEVKKWNEMLAAITRDLRNNRHEDMNSGYWNWSSFKRAFKGMFSGTPNLAGILKDIKHLDISEFFNSAEEGKPFLKEMFESFSSFWKKTSTKSREFFVKALQELGSSDFTRIFSPLSSHEETHPESPKKSETTRDSVPETDSTGEPNDSNADQELRSSSYKDDWNKFKSDWLFQRATNREKLRHAARMKPMNWYLQRGHSTWRSPMTKEQEELLGKMEASVYPKHAKSYGRESKNQKE